MNRALQMMVGVLAALTLLASCHAGENNPGRAYAPDMVYSKAYEPYYPSDVNESGMSAIEPVSGTVPYGEWLNEAPALTAWPFPEDTSGIMGDIDAFINPVAMTPEAMADGEKNYNIYCGICHGGNMQGKGWLVQKTPYGQAPANLLDDRLVNSSEGYLNHIIQYGLNAMGSYAYAMTREERWEVVGYIKSYQTQYLAEQAAAAEEAAETDETEAEEEITVEELEPASEGISAEE
jgi:mono/diheme cytochrome c family protein